MAEDDDKIINPEEENDSQDQNQPQGDSIEENEFDDEFGLDDDVAFDTVDRDQAEEAPSESVDEVVPETSGYEDSSLESGTSEESTSESLDAPEEQLPTSDSGVEGKKPAFDPSKYQQKNRAPLIIGLIVALIILGGGGYYFFVVAPENARQEELARIEVEKAKKAEEARKAREAEEKRKAEEEARLAQEEAAKAAEPKAGEISTITQKTGRSYVVVGSFVDGDFANDFSMELAAKGANPKILVPEGGKGFHRVAVEEYETFVEAENRANEVRNGGDFGDQVWPLRF